MVDRKTLQDAIDAGALDKDAAAKLEDFIASRSDPAGPSDPESLRFLANFNDVFIAVGIVLLSLGLAAGSALMFAGTGSVILIVAPVLAVQWLMLEYFAGRRRLLLPSMVLALMITLNGMILAAMFASGISDLTQSSALSFMGRGLDAVRDFGLWASAGAAIAALGIYLRFRLPFSLFLLAGAAAICAYTLAASFGDLGLVLGGAASFAIGVATLCVAIVFDARDPDRRNLSSDNAFWLHFAAAPQIMLGLRGLFGSNEIILLLALVFFSLLSLALNRRALVVSALLSYWLALSALVGAASGGGLNGAVWTLVLLGGAIVLLGGGWSTARRAVLSLSPRTGFFARIFPPEPA